MYYAQTNYYIAIGESVTAAISAGERRSHCNSWKSCWKSARQWRRHSCSMSGLSSEWGRGVFSSWAVCIFRGTTEAMAMAGGPESPVGICAVRQGNFVGCPDYQDPCVSPTRQAEPRALKLCDGCEVHDGDVEQRKGSCSGVGGSVVL